MCVYTVYVIVEPYLERPFVEGHPQVQRIHHALSDFIIVEDGNLNGLIRSICRFAMFFHAFHPEENLCVIVVSCRN